MGRHGLLAGLGLVVIAASGCGSGAVTGATGAGDTRASVVEGDLPWTRPTDCRAHIAEALCVVGAGSRACQGGEQAYVARFEALYDSYPAALQKMFCSLRHLYLETSLTSTAYAEQLLKSDGSVAPGANVGIRKSVLDESLRYSSWASWKEQLSFGGPVGSYTPQAGLPVFSVSGGDDHAFFLYMVLAHEFGHLFDFANHLNAGGGWTALSWADTSHVSAAQDYANRAGFCFYGCAGSFLASTDANVTYTGLYWSNFITTYASTNPWDDFAESAAFWFAANLKPQVISLDTGQGQQFNLTFKVSQPVFASKASFLSSFFGGEVRYP